MSKAAGIDKPKRGLDLAGASHYIGVGPDKFTAMMDDGRMPQPRLVDGVRLWDVKELDIYFEGLPRDTRTARERQRSRFGEPFHPTLHR